MLTFSRGEMKVQCISFFAIDHVSRTSEQTIDKVTSYNKFDTQINYMWNYSNFRRLHLCNNPLSAKAHPIRPEEPISQAFIRPVFYQLADGRGFPSIFVRFNSTIMLIVVNEIFMNAS